MSNETIKHITVNASQIIYRIPTIASTASRHLTHIRFCLHLLSRSKIILHIQPNIISGNLLSPFRPESSSTSSVRKHHHIPLSRHQPVAPTIRPILAQCTLRPSKSDKYGRIHLSAIEFWRIKDPSQHILSINSLHDPSLCLIAVQLRQYMSIFRGYLLVSHLFTNYRTISLQNLDQAIAIDRVHRLCSYLGRL